MLIFISWSGQRSKVVAEALETWLAQVIQAVEPWISQDIEKGLRWGAEIADRLERSKVGIICLTKSNLDARWIHFEAGALSKSKDAYVCTLLLDIKPSDVEQPLAQFQHTTIAKEDIFQLLTTINRSVQNSGKKALAESALRDIFETYWPRLKEVFQKVKTLQESEASPPRPVNEMLYEMLEILRNQERRRFNSPSTFSWIETQQEGNDATISPELRLAPQMRLRQLQNRADQLMERLSTEKLSIAMTKRLYNEVDGVSSARWELYKKLAPLDASTFNALQKLDERLFELESMYLNALKTVYSEAEEEDD